MATIPETHSETALDIKNILYIYIYIYILRAEAAVRRCFSK